MTLTVAATPANSAVASGLRLHLHNYRFSPLRAASTSIAGNGFPPLTGTFAGTMSSTSSAQPSTPPPPSRRPDLQTPMASSPNPEPSPSRAPAAPTPSPSPTSSPAPHSPRHAVANSGPVRHRNSEHWRTQRQPQHCRNQHCDRQHRLHCRLLRRKPDQAVELTARVATFRRSKCLLACAKSFQMILNKIPARHPISSSPNSRSDSFHRDV